MTFMLGKMALFEPPTPLCPKPVMMYAVCARASVSFQAELCRGIYFEFPARSLGDGVASLRYPHLTQSLACLMQTNANYEAPGRFPSVVATP